MDVFLWKRQDQIKMYNPGSLVQSCSSVETLMGVGGILGFLNTVQAIWLDSKTPISPEQIKESIWILSRQISQLQLCLSRRGFRLWFKKMNSFSLDFETTTMDVMEIYQQLIDTKYDLFNGPLWKVRHVLYNDEEKTEYYSAALIFSIHHSITDGTSNMILCREFLSILNKINKGQKVEPRAIPLYPKIDNSVKIWPRLSFLTKYFCRRFLATIVKNYYHKTSFNGVLPVPKTKEATTKVIFDDFTKIETENLTSMCREAKITINSFISTLTNFVLLALAQIRSDKVIGKKKICASHSVNMRRYMNNLKELDMTGCHVSFLEHKTKMSLADIENFWEIAKQIDIDIKHKLNVEKLPFNIVPIIQTASIVFLTNDFLIKLGRKNKTDCHYMTSNMGNLKEMLPGPKKDDNTEISYILRSVSCQKAGNPFMLTFHTFRERFMISLDYYTNKIEEKVAQEFFVVLCQCIHDMANF